MKKYPVQALLFAALFAAFSSAGACTAVADSVPYRLAEPSLVINFVDTALYEVSGLGPTNETGVFCAISDERGEVLFMDGAAGGAILRRVSFREKGDFEGVELVGKCLYAVRSNGEVSEIARWNKDKPRVSTFKTFLTKDDDVEGLGYDLKRHALLLACKGNPENDDVRHVYAFDLKSNSLTESPAFTINPREVNELVPYNDDDKRNFFSPSGVAVHPISGDVYVVSTALKRLVVLDYLTGKIRYAARLYKKILPQPEGIAFDAEGNLFLSSEGKKGDGMLLRFDLVR
ncbi:MAG: SdiA-regulated domain-containing protein [Saprospiraceae bacterium]